MSAYLADGDWRQPCDERTVTEWLRLCTAHTQIAGSRAVLGSVSWFFWSVILTRARRGAIAQREDNILVTVLTLICSSLFSTTNVILLRIQPLFVRELRIEVPGLASHEPRAWRQLNSDPLGC